MKEIQGSRSVINLLTPRVMRDRLPAITGTSGARHQCSGHEPLALPLLL